MILTNVDLSQPLTDHPFWRDVRGVWMPIGNLAGKTGTGCGTLYDLSPYRNHATQSTASYQPKWKATERGLACEFDGSDDYVEGNQRVFTNGTIFSICAYVIPGSTAAVNQTIIGECSQASSSGYVNGILLRTNGTDVLCHCDVNGHAAFVYRTNTEIAVGKPATICATSNVAYTDGELYVNGKDVTPIHNNDFDTPTTTNRVTIGRTTTDTYTYEGFWNGSIIGLFAFTRQLSESEAFLFHDQSLKGYPDLIAQTTGRLTCYITNNPIGFASNVPA